MRQNDPRDLEGAQAHLAPIVNAVGAASPRLAPDDKLGKGGTGQPRLDMRQGGLLCAKASRRGVIAALIVKTETRPLSEDVVESPGSLSLPKGR
jgi:hypothetical protein